MKGSNNQTASRHVTLLLPSSLTWCTVYMMEVIQELCAWAKKDQTMKSAVGYLLIPSSEWTRQALNAPSSLGDPRAMEDASPPYLGVLSHQIIPKQRRMCNRDNRSSAGTDES
jgi:hypothetical protein